MLGTECSVYVDDIVIYSSSASEHAKGLENVLEGFDRPNLQLHPGKWVFAQPQVQYLGFVLSKDGISPSPEKVKAVKQYPAPTCVKVRAFLGLALFYRRLIPIFSEIARPMTELTRKEKPFTWESKQQEAFQKMKDRLCTAPVLAYPNFKLPFILSTDASQFSLGAILSQVQDGLERPICYASRQTNMAERVYMTSTGDAGFGLGDQTLSLLPPWSKIPT